MNKYTYDEPEVFKPRLYKKCELAMMYFPNATKESASRSFRRWLARCTMMMKRSWRRQGTTRTDSIC